jgi:hypothetical protein
VKPHHHPDQKTLKNKNNNNKSKTGILYCIARLRTAYQSAD